MTTTRHLPSAADQKNIVSLLKQAKKITKSADFFITTIPSNYAQIEYAVIMEELRVETLKLEKVFRGDQEKWHDEFSELCRLREQQNSGTYLSFTAIPESLCNRLYWNLASILYQPKSIIDMLAVLLPSIKSALTFQVADELLPKTETTSTLLQRAVYSLETKSLNELSKTSCALTFFTEIVSDSKQVFPLPQIKRLPFSVHQQLFQLLDEHPVIKKHFYAHNDDFKELSEDLNQSVLSPNVEISNFANELSRAGTRYSGVSVAAKSVLVPCARFSIYLDKLPTQFREALLATTTTDNKTLADVMKHLEKGDCVEIASQDLRKIQANKKNAELLATLPVTNTAQQELIRKKYRKPIVVSGFEHTKILPPLLKKQILANVIVNTVADYTDILLNLPIEEYADFFQGITVACDPALPINFADALQMFNAQQREAFFDAIVLVKEKFGGISAILKLAIGVCDVHQFRKVFALIPDELKPATLKEEGNQLWLFDAVRSKNPEIVRQIMSLYSDDDILTLIAKKQPPFNLTPIQYIVYSGTVVILETALERFTPQQLEVMFETEFKSDSALHSSLSNQDEEMFSKVCSYYPADKLFETMLKVFHGENVFHKLIRNEKITQIKTIMDGLTVDQRSIALKSRDESKISLGYIVAQATQDVFDCVLSYFSLPLQTNILITPDEKNNCLLFSICQFRDLTLLKWTDEFKQAIETTITTDGNTAFHYAAKSQYANNIFILLNLLPKSKHVSTLLLANKEGYTPIIHLSEHHAPESLRKLLEEYDADDRMKLLEYQFCNGSRPLHFAAQTNPSIDMIKVILDFYPLACRFEKLNEKNLAGKTPLFYARQNTEKAKYILSLYPKPDRLAAITPILDREISKTTIAALIELLRPEDLKTALMTTANLRGEGEKLVLHHIASCIDTNILAKLMIIYSPAEKYDVLTKQDPHGNTAIYYAMWNSNNNLNELIDGCASEDYLAMISIQNNAGETAAHIAAIQYHNDHFMRLLNFFSNADKLKMLMMRNRKGFTVFNYVCKNFPPSLLADVLKVPEKKDRLTLIESESSENYSMLDFAAQNPNYSVFDMLLQLYPASQRDIYFAKKNSMGDSVFHIAAHSNLNPFTAKKIFLLAAGNELPKIITACNKRGDSPLHLVIRKNSLAMAKMVLSLLSEVERKKAAAIEDINGDILLHHAVGNTRNLEEICKMVFQLYENGLSALKHENQQGRIPLHYAVQNISLSVLQYMLKLCSGPDLTALLLHKDKYGHTPLYYALKQPKSSHLMLMLDALSAEDKLTVIAKENLLHFATQKSSPEIVAAILKCIPEEKRLSAIKAKRKKNNTYDKTPWHYAKHSKNPAILQTLIQHLPQSDQVALKHQSYAHPLKIYSLFGYPPEMEVLNASAVYNPISNRA